MSSSAARLSNEVLYDSPLQNIVRHGGCFGTTVGARLRINHRALGSIVTLSEVWSGEKSKDAFIRSLPTSCRIRVQDANRKPTHPIPILQMRNRFRNDINRAMRHDEGVSIQPPGHAYIARSVNPRASVCPSAFSHTARQSTDAQSLHVDLVTLMVENNFIYVILACKRQQRVESCVTTYITEVHFRMLLFELFDCLHLLQLVAGRLAHGLVVSVFHCSWTVDSVSPSSDAIRRSIPSACCRTSSSPPCLLSPRPGLRVSNSQAGSLWCRALDGESRHAATIDAT